MSDKEDLRKKYTAFGAKLKTEIDESKKESSRIIQEGVTRLEKQEVPLLPDDLAQRLLCTKIAHEMPETLLPASYFEKPRFRGKEKYFQRLAADLLLFGLSYQRSYGILPTEDAFPQLFLENRPWWKASEKDIQQALKILYDNKVIRLSESLIEFESTETSKEMTRVLSWIGVHKLERVTIDLLCDSLELDPVTSRRIMTQLVREGIAKEDADEYWIPAFF